MIQFYHTHQELCDAIGALIVLCVRAIEKKAMSKNDKRDQDATQHFKK